MQNSISLNIKWSHSIHLNIKGSVHEKMKGGIGLVR